MLIILGGLPGTGKSTLARAMAERLGAVWLRIDSIEQAILNSAIAPPSVEDAGYAAAYALAEDNLRLGLTVIADSVNPLEVTRAAWRDVATRAGVQAVEIEVVCSDHAEHRRRVEARRAEGGDWLPDWRRVEERQYEPWPSVGAVLDTATDDMQALLERADALVSRG